MHRHVQTSSSTQGRQDFSEIKDHVRMAPDEMTASEADEFIENGLQDEIGRVATEIGAAPVADISEDPEDCEVQEDLGLTVPARVPGGGGLTIDRYAFTVRNRY